MERKCEKCGTWSFWDTTDEVASRIQHVHELEELLAAALYDVETYCALLKKTMKRTRKACRTLATRHAQEKKSSD